jgi:endonuclease/exonuclease/phosphatase (EEP) superfamily protein YafD
LSVVAGLLLGALSALVLVRLLGVERGSALVLLVGALPLTLLPAYGVLVLAAGLRRWRLAASAALLVLAHLLVVAPAVTAEQRPAATAGAPLLRVVTANLFVLNPEPVAAGRALRALQPDVLVVPELSAEGLAGLRESGLLDDLPHAVAELGTREETVGLFSRLPLQDSATRSAAGRELPRATVTVGGRDVRLLAAHPLPPVSVLQDLWRESLADLAQEVAGVDLPLVVAGDLNADRDHAAFRALLGVGLRDAHDALGRGLARTWPADLPALHLDHVLVRGPSLVPVDVREARIPGSDHLAVVADLAVL